MSGEKFRPSGHEREMGTRIDAQTLLQMLEAGPSKFRGQSAARIIESWVPAAGSGTGEEKAAEAVARIRAKQPDWTPEQARAAWEIYTRTDWASAAPMRRETSTESKPLPKNYQDYQRAVEKVIAGSPRDNRGAPMVPRDIFMDLVKNALGPDMHLTAVLQYFHKHPELIPDWVDKQTVSVKEKQEILFARLALARRIVQEHHEKKTTLSYYGFLRILEKLCDYKQLAAYVEYNQHHFEKLDHWGTVVRKRREYKSLSPEEIAERYTLVEDVLRDAYEKQKPLTTSELARRVAGRVGKVYPVSRSAMRSYLYHHHATLKKHFGPLWDMGSAPRYVSASRMNKNEKDH